MSSRSTEPGAPPDPRLIPLCVPNISGAEWNYVKDTLDTGWVSSAGPYVDRFEREFARAVGAEHAVAVTNGTAALHVALVMEGVGAGEEVIVPSLSFIAPANAVRYVGAFPVFLDVDDGHWQLSVDAVRRFLEDDCDRRDNSVINRQTGRPVVGILPVDILGHPCDLDGITTLAREYGLVVVEDATESLGARYRGNPVGGAGHPVCFSFNGNKLLTTGGGGMITTSDQTWSDRARYLTTQAKDDPIRYVHRTVGFNYRLTNVQAAMGCAQLERLEEFLARKREIRDRYDEAFAPRPDIVRQREAEWADSAWWLYTIRVSSQSREMDLVQWFAARGIQVRPLWQPLHRCPAHQASFHRPCPATDAVWATSLSLPSSTSLTMDEQTQVIDAVTEFVNVEVSA